MRRVTFSRNFTLSLSRTCQCYCKYCAFATHQAHVHAPVDVERILDEALKRNTKELLVLTGEKPEVNPVVAERLAAWGHEDFTSYVVWACERALERGMLPHTNLGVLSQGGPGPAARGDRVPGADAGVGRRAADGDGPRRLARPSTRSERLATIEAAGELKIPFTTGILVGIGESSESRVESLEAIAGVHERYGHIQEVILQNFVPHPRYYGAEVAEIADEASRERWAGMGMAPAGTDRGGFAHGQRAGSLSGRLAALAGLGEPGRRSRRSSA